MARKTIVLGLLIIMGLLVAACATAMPTSTYPVVQPTKAPFQTPVAPVATPTAQVEAHQVELEWPSTLRLGESDIVRLALIPSSQGYIAQAEFPEHLVETKELPIQRIGGYELSAVARLDGVGFTISPQGELASYLLPGEVIAWRWNLTPNAIGQQRLAISLTLHWTPIEASAGLPREALIFSRGFQVKVTSFLGLSRGQAAIAGIFGLVIGGGLSLAAITRQRGPGRLKLAPFRANPSLAIELHPGIELAADDRQLIGSLFQRYNRLVLESEFFSGYSGARTYLALPIRPDGRADAHTIMKVGQTEAIRREFENYEAFVKDTLPPVTARIQHPTVAGPGGRRAAIRYTFIAEPGNAPVSLRLALLAKPDSGLLTKLFETFGPGWWMQRRPYTFRLAWEYDRMLPTHYVIKPEPSKGKLLDGRTSPPETGLAIGESVSLRGFNIAERRPDGKSLSLHGVNTAGQPPLRVRWLGLSNPNGASGRVIGTRRSLLEGFTRSFDRLGLPDPLASYPVLLGETVTGSQSTIHGDLNLENILVGPGGMVWLVDFAQTRDGHPLYDFAHLEAELIAHIVAPQIQDGSEFIDLLKGKPEPAAVHLKPLLDTLHMIAQRCLFNTSEPREYQLALCMACLGALKFANLDVHARYSLYLAASYMCQELGL